MNEQHKTWHIIVNGREKTVDHQTLTFDEVVALAPNLPPPGEGVQYTVTFEHAEQPKSGTLIQGERVVIKDGTQFVVTATNRS